MKNSSKKLFISLAVLGLVTGSLALTATLARYTQKTEVGTINLVVDAPDVIQEEAAVPQENETTTEAAAAEETAEPATESATEAAAESVTEAPTETAAEPVTEAPTEAAADPVTEDPAEPAAETSADPEPQA